MAETVGSLADKISILELKLYHMREQAAREGIDPLFRTECEGRARVLERQRDDLVAELTQLCEALGQGRTGLRVYRQYKMYNDPRYRVE